MAQFTNSDGTTKTSYKVGKSTLQAGSLTAARTHTLPDVSGTMALYEQAALTLLATQTASASSSLDFNFNDWAKADFRYYMVELDQIAPSTDGVHLWLRTSTNGTSFDAGASDYTGCTMVSASNSDTSGSKAALTVTTALGNATNETTSGHIWVGPVNSGKHTHLRAHISGVTTDGLTRIFQMAHRRESTSETQGIRLLMSSGNIASGTVRLWGMR